MCLYVMPVSSVSVSTAGIFSSEEEKTFSIVNSDSASVHIQQGNTICIRQLSGIKNDK